MKLSTTWCLENLHLKSIALHDIYKQQAPSLLDTTTVKKNKQQNAHTLFPQITA